MSMFNTLSRRVIALVIGLAAVAAVTVAVWPASAADTARADGERLGEAVVQLRDAESYYEVDDALTEVRHATNDAKDHASDELDEQITEQGDALSHALNGFAGSVSTDDEWDQELYEYELDEALNDLESQASDFRSSAPEVTQAFYDGFQEGVSS